MMIIGEAPLDGPALLADFTARSAGAGAVASFMGLVREMDGDADARLVLEHYPGMTEREIEKIEASAKTRWPLQDTLIAHRYGTMAPGETIVVVAAAAAHRRPAFEAVDFLMDYLKTDAPFWKKEIGRNGARWIEPRADDHQDKSRWADDEEKGAAYGRN